jgi:hypothetical protein
MSAIGAEVQKLLLGRAGSFVRRRSRNVQLLCAARD